MVSAKAVKNQMVPSCAEWWCETENQATASEPHLSTIVQARRISLFSHIARMPDETEAKKILIAPPHWRTGRPLTTRMKTINYPGGPEIQY